MKRILILIVVVVVVQCTASSALAQQVEQQDVPQLTAQDSLAIALVGLRYADQIFRKPEVWKCECAKNLSPTIDSLHFEQFMALVKKYGFPSSKRMGKYAKHSDVMEGVMVMLLHNPHRILRSPQHLELLISEVKAGRMHPDALMLTLDKWYWYKSGGKRVLYGSQFGKPCIETKDSTNRARLRLGIPEIRELPDSSFKCCSCGENKEK